MRERDARVDEVGEVTVVVKAVRCLQLGLWRAVGGWVVEERRGEERLARWVMGRGWLGGLDDLLRVCLLAFEGRWE